MNSSTIGMLDGMLVDMELRIEADQEDDGRWIAEVVSLAGVMAYGPTRGAALRAAKILALRVVADQLENQEIVDFSGLSFLDG